MESCFILGSLLYFHRHYVILDNPMSKFNLDKFLKQAEKDSRTCPYCNNETLRKAMEEFLDKKANGETFVTINYMLDNCFVPILGAPKNQRAIYKHVRICLKRDIKTGKPLNA